MRKTILLLIILLIGMLIPVGFSTSDNTMVITYGETTYNNHDYKKTVDDFFKTQTGYEIKDIESKIITASEVNEVSSTITGKTYGENQIFSSALVDLNDNENLKVSVDKSKITTITGDMYISSLKSVGITAGHVYVTSPVSATGESALAGIMNSYEEATDVEIPDNVKKAANKDIYTQAEIVKNSDVDADKLTKVVDDVKQEVENKNITDHETIVDVITNETNNQNITLKNTDVEKLAKSIEEIQNVQTDIDSYQNEVSDVLNTTDANQTTGLFDILTQK